MQEAGGTSGSACGYNNCEEANKMSSGGERHEGRGKSRHGLIILNIVDVGEEFRSYM